MNVFGSALPSSHCERCHSSFYPPSLIEAHLEKHRELDDLFRDPTYTREIARKPQPAAKPRGQGKHMRGVMKRRRSKWDRVVGKI